MPRFLTPIDLSKNELQNYVRQNLASSPSNPKEGQPYFNTTDKRSYTWNGTKWVANDGLGATMTGDDIVTAINGSSSIIDDDNLSENVNEAIDDIASHIVNTNNPHSVDKSDVGLGNVDNKSSETIRSEITSTNVTDALEFTPLNANLKGANNGVAELDGTGKVPSTQLPSYVDDVLEYDNLADFHTTGETGKIYVAKDTNKTYRWGGSAYVVISETLALGETFETAYRGDRGKAAYDHISDSIKHITSEERTSWNAKTDKYSTTIGNGSATSFAVTHNLNTRNVIVSIAETTSPYEVVFTLIELTTVDSITVIFSEPPTSNQYTVTVIG